MVAWRHDVSSKPFEASLERWGGITCRVGMQSGGVPPLSPWLLCICVWCVISILRVSRGLMFVWCVWIRLYRCDRMLAPCGLADIVAALTLPKTCSLQLNTSKNMFSPTEHFRKHLLSNWALFPETSSLQLNTSSGNIFSPPEHIQKQLQLSNPLLINWLLQQVLPWFPQPINGLGQLQTRASWGVTGDDSDPVLPHGDMWGGVLCHCV